MDRIFGFSQEWVQPFLITAPLLAAALANSDISFTHAHVHMDKRMQACAHPAADPPTQAQTYTRTHICVRLPLAVSKHPAYMRNPLTPASSEVPVAKAVSRVARPEELGCETAASAATPTAP